MKKTCSSSAKKPWSLKGMANSTNDGMCSSSAQGMEFKPHLNLAFVT